MMVLLITLLKINNSCCVWVPSEAPIFNRNEWYNTVDLKSLKSQISHRFANDGRVISRVRHRNESMAIGHGFARTLLGDWGYYI